MIIKRSSVHFQNVLSTTAICKKSGWHLVVFKLRNAVIRNGLYATGCNNVPLDEKIKGKFFMPIYDGQDRSSIACMVL